MNRAVVSSFLIGVFTSRFMLGFAALFVFLGMVKFFPDLKFLGLKVSEAGIVMLVVSWVLIVVHKGQARSKESGG